MPVPKGQQKRYSMIVASLQKRHGMSLEKAKAKADKAVKDKKE